MFNRLIALGFIVSLGLANTGCGVSYLLGLNSDWPADQPGTPVPERVPVDFGDLSLDEVSEFFSYSCRNANDCPQNVVLILSQSEEGKISTCTGSYVRDDLIMTNSHCIPSHLKEGDDCSESMITLRPMRSSWSASTDKNSCQKLVYHSKLIYEGDAFTNTDLAFFTVQSTSSHMPFSLKTKGIAGDSKLKFYAAQSQNNSSSTGLQRIEYRLERRDCVTRMNTVLTWSYVHPWAELVSLFPIRGKDCRVLPGNSGSPLMTSDNQVVGVVQAVYAKKASTDPKDDRITSIAGIATNLSCLFVPGTPLTHPDWDNCRENPYGSATLQRRNTLWTQIHGWSEDLETDELRALRRHGAQLSITPVLTDLAHQDLFSSLNDFHIHSLSRLDRPYSTQATVEVECIPSGFGLSTLSIPRRLESTRVLKDNQYMQLEVEYRKLKSHEPEVWNLVRTPEDFGRLTRFNDLNEFFGLPPKTYPFWRSHLGNEVPICEDEEAELD